MLGASLTNVLGLDAREGRGRELEVEPLGFCVEDVAHL